MASPVLPNPSNFLAVALAISRSKDGPGLVFHYPPHVSPPVRRGTEPSDDNNDEDDILVERASRVTAAGADHEELADISLRSWNIDDHDATAKGDPIIPWQHFAGFPVKELENLLTPGRSFHKSLFQVSIDPIYCVSYPIYVPEDTGIWKKKKKKETKKPARNDDEAANGGTGSVTGATLSDSPNIEASTGTISKPDTPAPEEKKSSLTMFNLVFFLNPKEHEAKELVNIMYQHIIKKVNKAYKYSQQRCDFVWKESKKILQLKEKGVMNKTKMSVLWEEILNESSLAASMQEIYEAISQNKIAALQLEMPEGPPINHSVQIPVPFYLEDLPENPEEANTRGLWLTTANTFGGEALEDVNYVSKNFALLLMDDEKKIINELQADAEQVDQDTMKMIKFVQLSKPTLSFHQVAQNNVLSLGEIREFTRHFIYWRRAIAIPPLHARDVYMVSPNCDLSRLPKASEEWQKRFPLVPSLAEFLAEMSSAPRPYKHFCPSKSHRPLYFDMLAWLMRGGWVSQLCTFAYVVVWPEIIYEVEYVMEAEAIKKAAQPGVEKPASSSSSSSSSRRSSGAQSGTSSAASSDNDDEESSNADTAIQRSVEDISRLGGNGFPTMSSLSSPDHTIAGDATHGTPLPPTATPTSPSLLRRAYDSSASLSNTTATSTVTGTNSSSNRLNRHHPHHHTQHQHGSGGSNTTTPTAEQVAEQARLTRIADRKTREAADRASAHARKIPPRATRNPSTNSSPHLAGIAPFILLDPARATGRESLFLDAIRRRLVGTHGHGHGHLTVGGHGATGTRKKHLSVADAAAAAGGSSGGGRFRHTLDPKTGAIAVGDHGSSASSTISTETTAPTTTSTTATAPVTPNPPSTYPHHPPPPSNPSTYPHHPPPTNPPLSTSTYPHHPGPRASNPNPPHLHPSNPSSSNHPTAPKPTTAPQPPPPSSPVAEAWDRYKRYFNGRYALERVALLEDVKRKEAWNLMTGGMSEYLITVRHW